ncbi:MAG: DUF2207 domain-containing protein, partial [Actinobacteria bacterium]|nr:DUF2207 domain-containing protein [Actinomycetota bacterium]
MLLVGPVINKPLSFDDVIKSAKIAEVDWVARDAKIDYAVERGSDGSFSTTVTESYTADFLNGAVPDVRRSVVTEFQGHDARFALRSATIDGEAAETRIDRGPATTGIRIAQRSGADLDGKHRIVLVYELHNLVTSETDEATGKVVDEWNWPVLAPSWPQATKGIEVSFTLPRAVNDALVRAPQAQIAWLLVTGSERLTPDRETADSVRYAFTNDQTLPPNSEIWISSTFAAGTFAQPPTTPFFWWQTYGPLIPLALLAVILLFSIAARRIVWADSAGAPWYLPRSEPPALPGEQAKPRSSKPRPVTAELAARLLGKPRHAELVDALEARPQTLPGSGSPKRRERWLGRVARAGHRAGRAGNAPAVWARRSRWALNDPIVVQKLRWVPDSYVRDTFVLAPLALTLLQWGLLRQLSEQVILLIVWWPAAFVLISTALALATLFVVRRPRPLTPAGAALKQQLKGIDAYARTTRLLDRGPVDEPLLPYAILFESPRAAGDAAVDLAVVESGDRGIARGWRTEGFVSAPAMISVVVAIGVLAASIVTVSTQSIPYPNGSDHISESSDVPGTLYTQVTGMDVAAELSRGENGRARLDVVERNTVNFETSGSRVPQFIREWPTDRLGQSLGLELASVRIDGAEVPFRRMPQPQTHSLAIVTQLEQVLEGPHEVEIRYALTDPIVAAPDGPRTIEQLRWTAWYSFWEDEYYPNFHNPFDGSAPVRPLRVQFTLAPELADAVIAGGWIGYDSDRSDVPGENGNWIDPWVSEQRFVSDHDDELHTIRVGSERVADDGSLVKTIDVGATEVVPESSDSNGDDPPTGAEPYRLVSDELSKYQLGLTSDLGVRLDFEPGTFSGVRAEAFEQYRTVYELPFVLLLGLAGAVIAASLGTLAFALRARRSASASLATIAFGAIPIAAVAQCVLFFWCVGPMPGDDGRIPGAMAAGGVMLAAVIAQAIVVGMAGGGRGGKATSTGA